jgi:hypothetical protein
MEDRFSFYKTLIRSSFAEKKSIFIILPTEKDIENFQAKNESTKKHLMFNIALTLFFSFVFFQLAIVFAILSIVLTCKLIKTANKINFWNLIKNLHLDEKQKLINEQYR